MARSTTRPMGCHPEVAAVFTTALLRCCLVQRSMERDVSDVTKSHNADQKILRTPDCIALEMRDAVILAGGNRHWNDTRQSWLARAAQTLGISPRRASSLFYQKARAIPAWEADNIRLQLAQLRARQTELGKRHEALETALRTSGAGCRKATAPLFRDPDGLG